MKRLTSKNPTKLIKLSTLTVILAIGLFLSPQGRAETVIWQEPMVVELKLEKPGTYESDAITAKGTINSLTANWRFQGEAGLEISADNGRSYVSLVNGVPIKEGFIPGNLLRYKLQIKEDSSVESLTLAYNTDASDSAYSFINPKLSGFGYRMAVYIARSGGSRDLFNYPVKITLPAKIKGISGPVRFTAADGQTLLAHFREGYADSCLLRQIKSVPFQDAVLVDFWVKVPQITKEGVIIYVYFDNPEAEDLSCPEEVFEFFDSFQGEALDANKWQFLPDLKGG